MIFYDFEYRDNTKGEEVILFSWWDSYNDAGGVVDLRGKRGRRELTLLHAEYLNSIWVAYNASADLSCLLALGHEIKDLKCIDLMAECRMITLSHPDFLDGGKHQGSLLNSMKALKQIDSREYLRLYIIKEQSHKLILDNEEYTEDQWNTITEYGYSDVMPMSDLLARCIAIHEGVGTGATLEEMLFRGRYVNAVTELAFKSKGFPINVENLDKIYGNMADVKGAIAREINELYCKNVEDIPLFKEGRGKKIGTFSKSVAGFEYLINNVLKIDGWMKTPSGKLSTKGDYIEKMAGTYGALKELKRAWATFDSLSDRNDLRKLESGGHIKAEPFTFGQVTSRNSPKPTKGFVLNMAPWFRNALIKPHRGCAMIGIDWQQQEIGIAAALSGDENMKRAYMSGDPYLELAKMAGAVPQDATKKSHSVERQQYKSVQLGLSYGKELTSLGVDIRESSGRDDGSYGMTEIEALERATEIYEKHRETYSVYWNWVEQNISDALAGGYIKSADGWCKFVGEVQSGTWAERTRKNQLTNFPLQANAACMLRLLVISIRDVGVVDMICSLHDAVYINIDSDSQEDIDMYSNLLVKLMENASRDLLGEWLVLGADCDVYTNNKPYSDPRGEEMYNKIAKAVHLTP